MTITGRKYFYEEEAGGAAGAGGGDTAAAAAAAAAAGAVKVAPADARKFLTDFVPDPKGLDAMKDDDVVAYHGRVSTALDKVRPKAPPAGTWPDKWREEMAEKDEKVLARLARYNTPKDVGQALIAAQNRISSGELKSSLPKDASVEQIKAWRAENGIPEDPAKYEIKLKDGLVIGDEDKPIVEAFSKAAHGANFNSAQVSAALDWYYDELDRQTEVRAAADQKAAQNVSDALHKEWGNEFRLNMNIFTSFMDSAPTPLKESLMRGRLADGTPVGSSAEVIKWISLKARELNPAGIIVPAGGGSMAASIDDEIKAIETLMRAPQGSADYKKYWDDAKVSGPGGRYQQLLNAREKAKAQA